MTGIPVDYASLAKTLSRKAAFCRTRLVGLVHNFFYYCPQLQFYTDRLTIAGSYHACSDAELVLLLTTGDHRAYTEIYNRYVALLYRHAHKVLRDTDACNDVVQDVFLAVWNNRESLRITDSLAAYLYKAIKNRALDLISHQHVVEKYVESIRDFANQGLCITEERIREKELLAIIEAEKAKLPPRTRQVYELNREQELSYREIGERFNVSEKTVKKQVHNALRVIRIKISSLLTLLFFF